MSEFGKNNDHFIKVEGETVSGILNDIDPSEPVGSANNVQYQLRLERTGRTKCKISIVNFFNGEVLAIQQDVKIRGDEMWKTIMKRGTKSRPPSMVYSALMDIFSQELPHQTEQRIRATVSKAILAWDVRDFRQEDELPIDDTKLEEFAFKDEVMQEAEAILSSENPREGINKHLDNIIAGERDNKLFVFVLGLSGKCKDKNKKTIVCALHEAGAGKTWILKNIVFLYNSYIVSHLTKRALNYLGDELKERGSEILFIKELGRLDQENDTSGNASIKMLSVDDGGLVTTYTFREDDGTFATRTVYTDPITVFTSSVRKKIDDQFVRRYWVFSPDASIAQTRRIEKFKVRMKRQEAEVMMGLRAYTDYDYSLRVLRCLVSLIEDAEILVPFYESVYSIMDKSNLRIRGDYDKISLLLELYGMLNCRNLPKVRMNGRTLYVLTPEKALDILKVARQSLIFMARGTEARDYELLTILKEFGIKAVSEEYSGDDITNDIINQMAHRLRRSVDVVRKTVRKFVSLGFFHDLGGKPKVYKLNRSVEEIEAELSGYRVLEDEGELKKVYMDMVREGNKFLKERGIELEFKIRTKVIF